MELTLNFFIILAFAWCCARWAHRVSNKLPGWMHQDWLNQAETFIAQKDDAMNPDAPPADPPLERLQLFRDLRQR